MKSFTTLLLLLAIIGCGRTIIKTGGVKPIISDCEKNLIAYVSVQTPESERKVNSPIAFQAQASECAAYQYRMVDNEGKGWFSRSLDFSKTYSQPQNVTENFVIEAVNQKDGSRRTLATSVTFNVLPDSGVPPTPTPTLTPTPNPPTPPPPPPAALECDILRTAQVVTALGEPMKIKLTSNAAGASARLNGLPAPLNVVLNLLPAAPAFRIYAASVQVTYGSQVGYCSRTFEVPTCTHQATATTSGSPDEANAQTLTSGIATETRLYGPIAEISIDGKIILERPVPPSNVLIQYSEVPFEGGWQTSLAKVTSPGGDTTSCSASYLQGLPVESTYLASFTHLDIWGFSAPSKWRVVSELGYPAPFFRSYRYSKFEVPVIDANASTTLRNRSCRSDEVMVGKGNWAWTWQAPEIWVECGRLRNELEIRQREELVTPFNVGTIVRCPDGKVITGVNYLWSPVSAVGDLVLSCGRILNRQ